MFGIPFNHFEWQDEYCPKELSNLSKFYRYYEEFSVTKVITMHDMMQGELFFASQIEAINRIQELKERKIKEALKELYQKILERYKELARLHKLELTPENYHEDILHDITYYDLIPGSTAISFEIKTTRCLVRNQSP